jgi:hypothetical protein
MRYRSANIIPGVNPPTGNESDEIRRPTGAAGGLGRAPASAVAVGACDNELIGVPQDGQNLWDGDVSPPQDGQFIYALHSGFLMNHQKREINVINLPSRSRESQRFNLPVEKTEYRRQNSEFRSQNSELMTPDTPPRD